jgi:AcrR family transcriptional regulator
VPARRDPPLSVDEIVATALDLTGASGLRAVSMRAVAAALRVTPMALYHHVADRERLVALVIDGVVAGVPEPDAALRWDRWLADYHDALGKRIAAFPGVAQHLLENPSIPAGASIRRRTVEVLLGGGFDRRTALLASSTFHTYLLGRLAVRVLTTKEQRLDEPAWHDLGLTGQEYADFGLRTLLAGLEAARAAAFAPAGVARARRQADE